jgi:transcriptional regulator with XRE-family HTH domain|nr:MAG TPA: repressor protein [Caudoviricetes sp.]
MTLRERVKILCKEQKTSLNALETECGFAKGYASKLDKSTPNAENLRKIADFFNVSVDYLMTGKEPEEDIYTDNRLRKLNKELRNNTEFYNMVLKYLDLSEKKKKHVSELIDLLSE